MKQPAHTITIGPCRRLGFGERMAMEATSAMLRPLQHDDRITVLLNLLGGEIVEDQVDAIVDVLRLQLKLKLTDWPPMESLTMERRKIVAALDDHDYEQLELLARIKKIKLPELVRRIIRAHLDGVKHEER